MIERQLTVTGRVQGVGFRYAMQAEAARLGVAGWVRNRRDGAVEALLQGPAPAVEALIAWTRRGPPLARVADVALHDRRGQHGSGGLQGSATQAPSGTFEILPGA